MLKQARKRHDIEWVLGDLGSTAWEQEFDLVVMTGHAFQVFVGDDNAGIGPGTFLVVSYMRLVAGVKFAVVYVGAAQLVYLVGFSYAFFWVGLTGLTLTIGAIATLFVLMQATGKIDWYEVFSRSPGTAYQKTIIVPPLPGDVTVTSNNE